jgi:hypothetical protein
MLSTFVSHVALAQRATSVFGSRVDLNIRTAPNLSGELLAARGDSLWLLQVNGRVHTVFLADVLQAKVPHGGLTSGKVLLWTVVGSVLSGALLTTACNRVEGTDCSFVMPTVLISWGVVGGISAAISGSGMRSVNPGALAPYARFPQGLPDGFVPER